MRQDEHDTIFGFPPAAVAVAIVIAAAAALYAMGHVLICTCGTVKLWHGVVNSSENSQHITDWYTFSHIIHGFIFYAIALWAMPNASFSQRLVAAIACEAGWEILENTPMVIDRYRAATIALSYYGDSVVNSISDIGAMVLGFVMARRLPVAATVALAVTMELATLYIIRDNLALNVLMLVYPIDAVKAWQAAAGG